MKLTGRNTRYDSDSGAFLVQQSDEMKVLMRILERIDRVERKLDALAAKEGAEGDGGKMDNQ